METVAGRGGAQAGTGPGRRIVSIDLLRGIVMVLMALDHARDYYGDLQASPLDLATTSFPLFATRWVTHLCAPVFVLLAGTSAWLHGRRLPSRAALARFLVSRGLWLVLLELTVVNFGWMLSLRWVNWQVIAAIGVAMIALGGLVLLPVKAVGAVGLAIVGLHDLLDPIRAADLGAFGPAWRLLHDGSMRDFGLLPWFGGGALLVVYPVLPWIGVMATGYALGPWIDVEPERRRRRLLVLGSLLVLGFVLLRWTNAYGDPDPWSAQERPGFTLLSFVNTQKYPPSLLFLAMTLGPALLLLSAFENAGGRVAGTLATYGRVPLFYYVVHIYVLSLSSALVYRLEGGRFLTLLDVFRFGPSRPDWYAHGLPVVYVAWIACVALLYPACRWFAGVKRRHRSPWLSYL